MSAIVIENISADLYAKIEQQAKHYHRSITQQVVSLLEDAMTQRYPSQSEKLPSPRILDVKPDNAKELDIINQRAEQLNEEALDVLTYQVEL